MVFKAEERAVTGQVTSTPDRGAEGRTRVKCLARLDRGEPWEGEEQRQRRKHDHDFHRGSVDDDRTDDEFMREYPGGTWYQASGVEVMAWLKAEGLIITESESPGSGSSGSGSRVGFIRVGFIRVGFIRVGFIRVGFIRVGSSVSVNSLPWYNRDGYRLIENQAQEPAGWYEKLVRRLTLFLSITVFTAFCHQFGKSAYAANEPVFTSQVSTAMVGQGPALSSGRLGLRRMVCNSAPRLLPFSDPWCMRQPGIFKLEVHDSRSGLSTIWVTTCNQVDAALRESFSALARQVHPSIPLQAAFDQQGLANVWIDFLTAPCFSALDVQEAALREQCGRIQANPSQVLANAPRSWWKSSMHSTPMVVKGKLFHCHHEAAKEFGLSPDELLADAFKREGELPDTRVDLAPQSKEARELTLAKPGLVDGRYHLHALSAARAYQAIGFYQTSWQVSSAAKGVGFEAMLKVTAALDVANLAVSDVSLVRNF